MTFDAEIKASKLRKILSYLSVVTDTAKLTVTPSAITAKAVDPAHVAMVSIGVLPSAFARYQADAEDIGLDLKKTLGILKLAGPGDSVALKAEGGRMTIRIGNITRRMNLVDTADMGDVKIPALSLSARVTLPSEVLMRGLRAVDGITDHLALKASPEEFVMSCAGDTDSMDLTLSSHEVTIDAQAPVSSKFPLDYLTEFVKTVPPISVDLSLDTDYPMLLTFGDDTMQTQYLLAPRIEAE